MVEYLLGAGVGESVGVRTDATSGAVYYAGGVVAREIVRQGFFRTPQTPAATSRGYGRVVGDEKACKGF